MRNIYVLFSIIACCLLQSLPGLAQRAGKDIPDFTQHRMEVNLGYFNAFRLDEVDELGIGFKYSGRKGAWRVGTGLDYWNRKTAYATYESTTDGYSISPRLGYEYHKWQGRIRVHYGADLMAGFSQSRNQYSEQDASATRSTTYRSNSYALKPFLGLTVFITEHISFTTETALHLGYLESIEERVYDSTNTTVNESSGLDLDLGPLGVVSVNFHF